MIKDRNVKAKNTKLLKLCRSKQEPLPTYSYLNVTLNKV